MKIKTDTMSATIREKDGICLMTVLKNVLEMFAPVLKQARKICLELEFLGSNEDAALLNVLGFHGVK